MSGFIEGENRYQSTLFPERVDDYVEQDSVVRVVDVFIDRLDISGLGFKTERVRIVILTGLFSNSFEYRNSKAEWKSLLC
jgi:hypothetical protein